METRKTLIFLGVAKTRFRGRLRTMETKLLHATPKNVQEVAQIAAETVRNGGLVAFPTETVYGLGANALDASAVHKIYAAKGRPADNPLIVHIAEPSELERVVSEIPETADKLMAAFWPGPISLLMKKHKNIPDEVTSELETVVVRMPSHTVARALIKAAGVPIAAPSANRSGNVSTTTAKHVLDDLNGRIDVIIDGGSVEFGLESTVIDCTSTPPTILRPGSISQDQIQAVIGHVNLASAEETPRSPGMKYRHYSPQTPLTLIETKTEQFTSILKEYLSNKKSERVAVISHSSHGESETQNHILPTEAAEAAPLLFDTMRLVDTDDVDEIIVESWPDTGIGTAIMDRLRKAASKTLT